MLHDPKTVIGSDFDQETAEKIAPPFIPRLELANCRHFKVSVSCTKRVNYMIGSPPLTLLFAEINLR